MSCGCCWDGSEAALEELPAAPDAEFEEEGSSSRRRLLMSRSSMHSPCEEPVNEAI